MAFSQNDWYRLPHGDGAVNAPVDPFAHLHDEDYAATFTQIRVGHADMIAVAGRKPIPLDGEWLFTLDLFDEGLRQKWYANDALPPSQWTAPRDYDLGADRTIMVPSCWTCVKPEWRFFEGGGWYTRNIRWTPSQSGERLFLRVGAANYEARVFLNGQFLGSHAGGSTPFFVELTDTIIPGGNRLQINVDNRREPERVPMNHFDWFNDGGLYREVVLLALPELFIKDFSVSLVPNGTFSQIQCTIELSDANDDEVVLAIEELGLSATISIKGGRGDAVIAANPDLWSPASPKLYDVSLKCGGDEVRDRIGFRDIRVDGMDIRLNGQPIRLNGACVHEDDVTLGKVTSDADIRRRLAHAKELGCNVLRLTHYPHHERVAEIADEVGMLLWAEIPVYWAIAFDNPPTYADAENQLLELIRRDRNRASVILWGLGNENADTDARYRFMASLAKAARKADPTRLLTAACLINRESFRIEDRLADHLDIIGINEYFGWYEPDLSSLERLLANSNPDRPVVISEFGTDALAGHHGPTSELFTEEKQAEFYRRQFEILKTVDWIKGTFAWLLYDFRSERRQTAFQKGFNRKGLFAEDKSTKKTAFSVVAHHYGSKDAAKLV